MGRVRFGVAVLVVVACLPGLVAAQGFLPTFQGMGSFDLGSVQVSPSAKVGYQYMAVNFNVPVPYSGIWGPALVSTSELDFKLQDAGVWVGGLGVNARMNRFSAFLNAEANARKNVRVVTGQDPYWAGDFSVEWRGSRLEWWAIDGGGCIDLTANIGIVGGLRLEHMSLRLADPVDPLGWIRSDQAEYGDKYAGDLLSKVWLPYIGIRTSAPYFKGLLRFSPVAFSNAKIPLRYTYIEYLPWSWVIFEDAEYTFKRTGLWLEGSIDSAVQLSPNVRCSLWLKGSWLQIRGTGREGYDGIETVWGMVFDSYNDSGSAQGVYSSYTLAGGLRGEAAF